MNKINIPFKGMTNVPDDSFSQDGSMSVLLNMRHKGGELVQCQPPTESPTNEDVVRQAIYHSNSGYWLELTDDSILYYRRKKDAEEGEIGSYVNSFAIMGNIVIMHLENSVEYAIWRNGGYVYLGKLPTSFVLDFKLNEAKGVFTSENKYSTKDRTASDYYKLVKNGFIDKALDYIYEKKGFVDRTILEYGLRLFDGSYIPVGYADLGVDVLGRYAIEVRPETNSAGGVDDEAKIITEFTYFTIDFPTKFPLKEGWKDIILGVDCFCCGSITNFTEITHSYTNQSFESITEHIYAQRDNEELSKAITEALYYRVATIGFNSTDIWMTNTSPSSIAQLDNRKDVVLTQNLSDNLFVFNNRMHSVSKYKVYDGYTTGSSNSANKAIDSFVVLDDKLSRITNKKYEGSFGKILMYPSEDALGIVISSEDKNDVFVFNHKKNGMSFYFETNDDKLYVKYNDENIPINVPGLYPDYYKIKVTAKNDSYGFYITITRRYNGELYMGGYWTKEICPGLDKHLSLGAELEVRIDYDTNIKRLNPITLRNDGGVDEVFKAKGNIVIEPNVLKVSAVDNPFYFPTAQTYKFEGNIVGLASNAEAISTGQFGQYPLFVFTQEGIWAMAVDASGQGAYTSQSPFSREVCSGAVCPVSGGIVFTTERGVMAISGGQVTELSAPLDGMTTDYMEYQEGFWEKIYEKAGFDFYFQPEEIREYLKPVGAYKTKLAYNYLHNEVILSNTQRDYSYVYSLANQEWSIIDRVFDITTNSYPELVVYNNIEQKRYKFTEGNDPVPVVAITRPVKVETLDFKRLRQAALRCTFEGSLNFYVLGSNDGASFVCITGKEHNEVKDEIGKVKTQRDLITSMSRSKQYKYIAIAVAGKMSGRISLAEMLVEGGFASNQLR